MTVEVLHPCGGCGTPGLKTEVHFRGEHCFNIIACEKCLDETSRELAQVRPVYEAMIACGVSEAIANETMTFMLDQMRSEG